MIWVTRIFRWSVFLGLIGFVLFLIFAPAIADDRMNPVVPHDPYPVSDAAQALHDRLIVGDWHADALLWKRDLLERNDRGHVDLPRLIEGGVALQVFTAVTKSPRGLNYVANAADAPDDITLLAMGQLWPPRTWFDLSERALYQAERLAAFAAASGGQLRVIRTRADLDTVLAAREAGSKVVGALFGIEGAHPLEGDMANLDRLEAAGLRVVGLQHFFNNEAGGSLHGALDVGLTEFGRALVTEVEARGMVLDIAHSSPRVVQEVLTMTDMPVVLSHGGIYSHCPSHRNLPDGLMVRIAEGGGVIGIGYWEDVICDDSPEGIAAAIAAAVELLGVEHVSLGSDFDGTVTTALDTSELAAITQALLDRGMSEDDIALIMGGNMVRILRDRLPRGGAAPDERCRQLQASACPRDI